MRQFVNAGDNELFGKVYNAVKYRKIMLFVKPQTNKTAKHKSPSFDKIVYNSKFAYLRKINIKLPIMLEFILQKIFVICTKKKKKFWQG